METYVRPRLKPNRSCEAIDTCRCFRVGIGGDPSAVDEGILRALASRHEDGVTPRYAFIGDKGGLIQKFEELAGRISR